MPSSTPERQERWIDDQTALMFLGRAGYQLKRDWSLSPPAGHEPTPEELDAIAYLVEEWDFFGLSSNYSPTTPRQT